MPPRWRDTLLLVRRIFRNRLAFLGFIFICLLVAAAAFAEQISPYSPTEIHYTDSLSPPSSKYLLGTDRLGRDQLSRIIYGVRSSLTVGFVSVSIATLVGVGFGLVAGYRKGWLDSLIMRTMDGLVSFPSLVLAIFMVSILGPSLVNAMIAVGIVFVPSFARITRATTLSLTEREFVEAAHSIGVGETRIMLRHILPNCLSPLIVQVTLGISRAILTEASLSFLGLGVQRPMPSWGNMVADGLSLIVHAPWTITFPGLAIFFTVLSFNFLGDGLREALDPRLFRTT